MLRALLILTVTIFGTNTYAQSVEERLPLCIVEADQLLVQGNATKTALEASYNKVRAADVVEVMFAPELFEIFNEALEESVKEGELASQVEGRAKIKGGPLIQKVGLVIDLLEEDWEKTGYNKATAAYIAACINNFGDEVETQAEQIAALQELNNDLQIKITEMENQLKAANTEAARNEVLRNNISKLQSKVYEADNRLKAANEKIESIEFYTQQQNKRNETKIRDLNTKIMGLEQKIVVLESTKNAMNAEIAMFWDIYKNASWLKTLVTGNSFERNEAIKESVLSSINVVNEPTLFPCVTLLRDKSRLGDFCAFNLASYISKNHQN
jgi:outer membrane murein-binding lipoprotein Lpp